MIARYFLAVCMLCLCASMYAREQKDEAPPPPSPTAPPQLPPDQPSLPKIQSPQQVRISEGVSQGSIIKRVQPTYPKEARKNRVQGTVVLQARISKTGDIADLLVISGDELLVPAAIKAVRQWKYKPYVLKGQPIEVQTRITLNFTLH